MRVEASMIENEFSEAAGIEDWAARGAEAGDAAASFPRDAAPIVWSFEPGSNHEERLAAVLRTQEAHRNPFLEAASGLLRCLAEMPANLDRQGVDGLHQLLMQEVQTYTRLCEQANLRQDHMLAVRYALCTALDEVANLKPWSRDDLGGTGMWSTRSLLNKFHGESQGGKTVFLLIGRLANSPQEHLYVLEVMHHILSLGFMGDYRIQPDGHRMIETIRHRLYTMVAASREPVSRELSQHWKGAGQGKFKFLRAVPVWVSASVLGLALFGQFAWYKYQVLHEADVLEKKIAAIREIDAPSAPTGRSLRLAEILAPEIAQGKVRVDENDEHSLVVFKGDGMFAGGLAQLSPSSRAMIDKVGEAINNVNGKVRVVGHTDNQPLLKPRPQFADNQQLSERRAQSVAKVLTEKGVDSARIEIVGKGDTQPTTPNTTAAGRALNRRVEIEVLNDSTKPDAQGK